MLGILEVSLASIVGHQKVYVIVSVTTISHRAIGTLRALSVPEHSRHDARPSGAG